MAMRHDKLLLCGTRVLYRSSAASAFLYPLNSSRRVHYYEVKFSFSLNMKMCLAVVFKGVD